jgi:hypothetical protein
MKSTINIGMKISIVLGAKEIALIPLVTTTSRLINYIPRMILVLLRDRSSI